MQDVIINSPSLDPTKNVSGISSVVQFIIEKDGSISNPKIKKSVTPKLDAEAIRLVKAMPKWKPGKEKGKTVRVKYSLPIAFK